VLAQQLQPNCTAHALPTSPQLAMLPALGECRKLCAAGLRSPLGSGLSDVRRLPDLSDERKSLRGPGLDVQID
jgi:hypothetical protein